MENKQEELVRLRCQIELVTYYNTENDYAVLRVRVQGYRELVTVVGNIAAPTPGSVLLATGQWSYHNDFGRQFKVVFYNCVAPSNVTGIEKYLGSGLIKGIGPKMARRIVDVFGENTLEVIEESVQRLLQVDGIGKHRVKLIADAWIEQKEIRNVMLFLQSHGVSSVYATKIYKQYGNESIGVVQDNPYKLAYDIWGIGFITADKIARNMGFSEDSPKRAAAALMFMLHTVADEGDVFCVRDELISRTNKLLQIADSILENAIEQLAVEEKVVVEQLQDVQRQLTVSAVYLAGYHLAEVRVAKLLHEIKHCSRVVHPSADHSIIDWVQTKLNLQLARQQVTAVLSALSDKITIITGGPGTGKTTITRAILEIFARYTGKIMLAAPTGRAAKRMSEATGQEAKTIHRLLEFNPTVGGFKHNQECPLDCDLLIIDEVSMVDNLLAYHLLKAVPKTAVLILIGDINQLPSVGAGSVLKDLIASKIFPVIELNEIFRQAQASDIVTNAHKIIHGEYPYVKNRDTDFYFLYENDPELLVKKLITVVKNRVPSHFGFNAKNDIQVLTPMNRGIMGTASLNEQLQTALNPDGLEVVRAGRKFRVGDKVMQIKNNYDKGVYNGDIGIITGIDSEEQDVMVMVDDRTVSYDYGELDELVLAYAVSIHKSQGSEYPVVVIPLAMSHYVMLQRNLIYTGITRGKKLVIIIGSKKAMHFAVGNNQVANRNTWLGHRCAALESGNE